MRQRIGEGYFLINVNNFGAAKITCNDVTMYPSPYIELIMGTGYRVRVSRNVRRHYYLANEFVGCLRPIDGYRN